MDKNSIATVHLTAHYTPAILRITLRHTMDSYATHNCATRLYSLHASNITQHFPAVYPEAKGAAMLLADTKSIHLSSRGGGIA